MQVIQSMSQFVARSLHDTALQMELGTASIVAQLLLILLLVVVFAGRRRMAARRELHCAVPTALSPVPSAALPVARRVAVGVEVSHLVSEELLPPCFADTCADWTQVSSGKDGSTAGRARDVLHNRAAGAPLRLS